jgi:peptidoglycan/LPS O-acetylase OafA/YrhL
MLPVVIVLLVVGLGYAISIAPAAQRLAVAIVFVALAAGGYAVAMAVTTKGTDQRTYYPIAGAIAGAMIGFGWVSNKRKQWAEERKQDTKP